MIKDSHVNKLSRYRGCIVGGAIGDALGWTVEFYNWDRIKKTFGDEGVKNYTENYASSIRGIITDDTQMLSFTAEALTQWARGKIFVDPIIHTYKSYQEWFKYQGDEIKNITTLETDYPYISKLTPIVDFVAFRAPGYTCLSSLGSGIMGTIENRINESKGNGTVMRIAPAGLLFNRSTARAIFLGEQISAITHGHDTAIVGGGFLAGLISELMQDHSLTESLDIICEHYTQTNKFNTSEILDFINRARKLSQEEPIPTAEIIDRSFGIIGTAEITLGVAIYCCLCYPDNFSKAVLAAINHSGDSDTIGAVTGNIMGAMLGFEAIPHDLITHLNQEQVFEQLATDMYDVDKDFPQSPIES
jgi:ADP-ribosylglycohydrolase